MPTIRTKSDSGSQPGKENRRRPKIAMPAKYRNRPASIRHAIYVAWAEMDQLGLTIAGVSVLQAIIATGVDIADPFQWIYAKKETIAKIAGVSEASVYRTLCALEKKEFIIRSEQGHRIDGSLTISKIALTEKIASLLFVLVASRKDDGELAIDGSSVETESRGAATADNTHQSPQEEPSHEAALSNIYPQVTAGLQDALQDAAYIGEQKVDQKGEQKEDSAYDQSTAPRQVRTGKYTVPSELFWLVSENRLSCPQLFELMKLAKKVPGQQISDFVELRRDRLKELRTTTDCYCYLKKLIVDNVDARFLLSQQQKKRHKEQQAVLERKAAEQRYVWLRDREGQTFIEKTTGKTYTVNSLHGLLLVGRNGLPDSRCSTQKATDAFVALVAQGKLVRYVRPQNDRIKDAPDERLQNLRNILSGMKRPLNPTWGAPVGARP